MNTPPSSKGGQLQITAKSRINRPFGRSVNEWNNSLSSYRTQMEHPTNLFLRSFDKLRIDTFTRVTPLILRPHRSGNPVKQEVNFHFICTLHDTSPLGANMKIGSNRIFRENDDRKEWHPSPKDENLIGDSKCMRLKKENEPIDRNINHYTLPAYDMPQQRKFLHENAEKQPVMGKL